MSSTIFTEAVAAADCELVVQVADTPDLVRDAFRLRHQVYCLERGYEPGQDGLEMDDYDAHASHVLLRTAGCGTVIGTARLVLPRLGQPGSSFPMQAVCLPERFAALPFRQVAEISRFALSKERRGLSMAATGLSRLALVRGLVQLSYEQGVTYWCAAMERTLLRLLRASSIHFQDLGPVVEYHGLRQPSFCHLPSMLDRMGREQPEIWGFVTGNGTLLNAQMAGAWRQRHAA